MPARSEHPPYTPGDTLDHKLFRLGTIVENILEQGGTVMTDEVYNNLENGLSTGSISATYPLKLEKAGIAYWDLNEKYMQGKTKKLIGSKIPYLSKDDEKKIKASSPIDSMEKLKRYVEELPLYLRKVEAVIEAHLTGPNAAVGATMIEGIPGVKDLVPLTEVELRLVHKMKLKQAVDWLEQNNLRNRDLRRAVEKGVIVDKNAFNWLRGLNPDKARKAIEDLTRKHKARKPKKKGKE